MTGLLAIALLSATPHLAPERVVIETVYGDVVVAPFAEVAPTAVQAFLRMARGGVYEGTHFPRVDRRFIIQASEATTDRMRPLTAAQAGLVRRLPLEAHPDVRHVPGIVGLAREDDDPDSARSSWYVITSTAPHLDGKYTAFGRVVDGMDVVRRIAQVPVDAQHRPRTRVRVRRAVVFDTEEAAQGRPRRPPVSPPDGAQPRLTTSETRAVVRTNYGDFVLGFHPKQAPRTVAQILDLMRRGAYTSTPVSFADERFAIQFAEVLHRDIPLSEAEASRARALPLEVSELRHDRGAVSLARPEDDPTGGRSSFVIVKAASPHLDGHYTVFGQVLRGMEVIDAIAAAPVDDDQTPRSPIRIQAVEVHDGPAGADAADLRPPPGLGGPPGTTPRGWATSAVFLTALLLGVIGARRWSRVPPRLGDAARMLGLLALTYGVVMDLSPQTPLSPGLGLGLFVLVLAAIRLMGTFEAPTPRPPRDR